MRKTDEEIAETLRQEAQEAKQAMYWAQRRADRYKVLGDIYGRVYAGAISNGQRGVTANNLASRAVHDFIDLERRVNDA